MLKANDYHKKALWQEKLRVLQDALAICDEARFPDVERRRQSLRFDVAGIWRRLGQYSRAEEVLRPLAVLPDATSSFKASVLGTSDSQQCSSFMIQKLIKHRRAWCMVGLRSVSCFASHHLFSLFHVSAAPSDSLVGGVHLFPPVPHYHAMWAAA